MRRFEYKILDAAVIEPDLTKSDFLHIHHDCQFIKIEVCDRVLH